MNIIVCMKQVPDTEAEIRIAPDSKKIVTDDIRWVMNPYDEFAVEEALRIKEAKGGEVTVIGLGPQRVSESIRTAFAMGVDNGILICDDALQDGDSLSTAKALAAAIKNLDYDLIFAGQRGMDEDLGIVGAAVAEFLDIPQMLSIDKVTIADDGKSVIGQKPIEGQVLVIESPLPALISTQKGLNEPRFTSVMGIMKAKKKKIEEKTLLDLNLESGEVGENARKVTTEELTPPPARTAATIINEGDSQKNAEKLVKLLKEEAKVI